MTPHRHPTARGHVKVTFIAEPQYLFDPRQVKSSQLRPVTHVPGPPDHAALPLRLFWPDAPVALYARANPYGATNSTVVVSACLISTGWTPRSVRHVNGTWYRPGATAGNLNVPSGRTRAFATCLSQRSIGRTW